MKVLFVSLGCDKNLVDSEVMLGYLIQNGYEVTDDENEAQAVVINTCCFIYDAKQESVDVILEMADLKKQGKLSALIVTGCLSQRYSTEIIDEIPEVDAVLGTQALPEIVDALNNALKGHPQNYFPDICRQPICGPKRVVTTGGHFAYLKIAEGCDKRCTYCIIPNIRGKYRSIPMESLIREATELVQNTGVKELILVAQETTIYGCDIYGKKMLPELLRELCKIPSLVWVRLLYCYPEEITEELIDVMATESKICHYLDMPIQHASDEILKRMGRNTTRTQLESLILRLRERIPDICLRTTLISGFPGETNEDHEALMEFVDGEEFDRLGVFMYSREEDTPAAKMPNQVPEEVKDQRRNEIMELQQEIAFEKADAMIGASLLAMIEGKLTQEEAYIARTYKDAPNVDGYLFVHTDKQLMTGDFVRVRITGSNEYDLIGELEDESCK